MKEYIDNNHVGYFFSSYMPSESRYFSKSYGEAVLYYDGVAYGATGQLKHKVNNIIYIPDDTAETTEAYVSAAQKRIDDYLGSNSGVEIAYSGPYLAKLIDDKSDESKFSDYNMDKTKFDGKEYSISYDGRVEYVLIYKNSSRMQTNTFFSSDTNNNINVKSNTASYPINTVLDTEILDKESDKYKALLKKLGVDNGLVVDINLVSSSIGQITDFDGETFEVSIPVHDPSLITEDMMAYFVNENGKIESHKVTFDGFIAKFNTSHFSEYVLAKNVVKNPQTGDNIVYTLLLGSISLIILLGTILINKKRFN